MADIRGFRGIRYAEGLLNESGKEVVAPPYDVIDTDEQEDLYGRHPNNVIRLILNRQRNEDTETNNRYTRARRHFMDWLARGVLVQEDQPALYAHYQDYEGAHGNDYTRKGFLGLVRLTEYDREIVLPHERTLKGPKVDRLKLMKACETNMSPVFLLYDDSDREVDRVLAEYCSDEPLLDVETERDDIRHRLWPVTDGRAQDRVASVLEDEQVLIADGHHRYETSLAYRDFRRRTAEEPGGDPPYDYTLAFFVNMHDPGLQTFPTHRIVHDVANFDADALRDELEQSPYFETEWLAVDPESAPNRLVDTLADSGERHSSFVFLAKTWKKPLMVRYVGNSQSPVFDPETGEEVRELDTAILHEAVFDRMVGIDKQAQEEKRNLQYTRDLDEAVGAVERNQLVVLMNATEVSQVVDICQSGGKMPQKSTYFYPKVLSGLAINPL